MQSEYNLTGTIIHNGGTLEVIQLLETDSAYVGLNDVIYDKLLGRYLGGPVITRLVIASLEQIDGQH